MQFWQAIAHTEVDQLAPFARIAEELGYTGVTSGDHFATPERVASPYPYKADRKRWENAKTVIPDPLIQCAALAQVTTRLRFMTTCYVLPMREPLAAAKAIATAAVMSGNRLVLGVGVGWMKEEFDLVQIPFATRGRRCDEMLDVIGKLLGGGMTEHHGELFDFPRCEMAPVPDQRVPILIAGHSDAAFRRAARWDGWVGSHYDVADLFGWAPRVQRAWREAGRSGAPQIVAAANDLSRPDQVRQLEDAGVTGVISMPLTWRGVTASSLDQKRAAMEVFANEVVAKAGSR
jgi:probable F420-dependent oxidoreductase